jgi:lipopolysaccharide biosynthesis glycosyltransferase
MKVCVCTIANYAYLPGAEVLFYSLKKQGSYETVLLSAEVKECRYADRIINYDNDILKPLRELPTKERLKWAWDKLMIFKYLTAYDRVIFMDSDIMILNEIKELYTKKYDPYDFAAFKLYTGSGASIYGGGTMVLNKRILTENTYDRLYEMAINYESHGIDGLKNAEESVINHWIKVDNIKCFDMDVQSWFVSDGEMPRIDVAIVGKDDISDKKFIHWVIKKPWSHPKEKTSIPFNEMYVEMAFKNMKLKGLLK